MSTIQKQAQENKAILFDVLSRWAPFPDEPVDHQMMRALLNLAAYEKDCGKINKGEKPIRTRYPLPLPSCPAEMKP